MSMMMFAPHMPCGAAPTMGVEVGGRILLLCGRGDDDAREEEEGELEDAEVVDGGVDGAEGEARWDRPEAWLVQSDSIDEASDEV